MRNRSRNNSSDQSSKINNTCRSNSIEFYIHSGSEKSTRSYSIGSIETIYLGEHEENHEYNHQDSHDNHEYNTKSAWDNQSVLTCRDSYDVPQVNKEHSKNIHNTSIHKRGDFVHQDTKKGRKRDVYVCDIRESPKPSKFMDYMKKFLRK